MKKCIILKPHEAAALARGETITIWRVCKPQPEFCGAEGERDDVNQWGWMTDDDPQFLPVSKCNLFPLNVPLLSKETWSPEGIGPDGWGNWKTGDCCKAHYRADFEPDSQGFLGAVWMPSSHMPTWAVRTLVTLSDVRVRRPCDVTKEEAKAMGFQEASTGQCLLSPQQSFCEQWSLAYGDTETAWNSYWWSYTATPTKKEAA